MIVFFNRNGNFMIQKNVLFKLILYNSNGQLHYIYQKQKIHSLQIENNIIEKIIQYKLKKSNLKFAPFHVQYIIITCACFNCFNISNFV